MLAGANAVRYRVEGPFESVTQAARRSDVVEVAYDPQWSVEGTVYDSLLHAPLPGADVWVRLRRPGPVPAGGDRLRRGAGLDEIPEIALKPVI